MRERSYRLSVVVPVLNEEECIPALVERLEAVLSELTDDYEILFVDDCSRDRTFDLISRAAHRNPRIKCLGFSRSRGHQLALSCGMRAATGDVVVSMDGDLQHPPELIPELVQLWRQGYDVVNTVRRSSGVKSPVKNGLSRLFYFAFNRIADIPLTPNSSDFRLLDRQCVDALSSMEEYFKFHRGLVHYIGFRQTEIQFDCPPRLAGKPAYNLKRSLRLASDGIFSFSTLPLRIPFYLGAAVLAVLSATFLYDLVFFLIGRRPFAPGWASLVVIVLLTFGVQLLFMGIFGLYISKIFIETKRRPPYFIQRSVGFGPRAEPPRVEPPRAALRLQQEAPAEPAQAQEPTTAPGGRS